MFGKLNGRRDESDGCVGFGRHCGIEARRSGGVEEAQRVMRCFISLNYFHRSL